MVSRVVKWTSQKCHPFPLFLKIGWKSKIKHYTSQRRSNMSAYFIKIFNPSFYEKKILLLLLPLRLSILFAFKQSQWFSSGNFSSWRICINCTYHKETLVSIVMKNKYIVLTLDNGDQPRRTLATDPRYEHLSDFVNN